MYHSINIRVLFSSYRSARNRNYSISQNLYDRGNQQQRIKYIIQENDNPINVKKILTPNLYHAAFAIAM